MAIKRLSSFSRNAVKGFMSEARLLATLRHPNIVMLLGAAVDARAGRLELALELCSSGSLARVRTAARTPAHRCRAGGR